jgi:predicted glutamine amidotransferase
MHNIIITLMLISLIYNYLFKRKATDLNCGIFAWTGTSPDKFNPMLFNILGVYNDSRGGDSCGVYFNRNSITGIRSEAKYEDLVKKEKLHTTIKLTKWPIVIGHCRKASVGSIIDLNVQPTIFRSVDKTNRIVYVQAHNGTITNHKELANKYDISLDKDESDSVTLGRLIYKKGWDILKEYEGSAALVMHFIKEPNVLYAFHGKSKNYSIATEERPLHYVNIKDSGIYISSEARPLEFISNGEKAIPFEYNTVYKIEGEKVTEVIKIERETSILKKASEVVLPFNNAYFDNYGMSTNGITKNICCSQIDFTFHSVSNKIKYKKGFYIIDDNTYAHGQIICDNWGYLADKAVTYQSSLVKYYLYFYYGILLSDKEAFYTIDEEAKKMKVCSAKEFYEQNNFSKLSDIVSKYAIFPFTRLLITSPSSGYVEPTAFFYNEGVFARDSFYTGKFIPLFSDIEIHFQEGDFIGYKRNQGTNLVTDLLRKVSFLKEWDFGENVQDKSIVVTSCEDCVSKKIFDNGERCMTCELVFKDDKKEEKVERKQTLGSLKEDDDENYVVLIQSIIEDINPVIADLEDLAEDIEISGLRHSVQDEFDLIQEALDTLKTITK